MKLEEILASVWKVVEGEEEESFLLSNIFKLLLTCGLNHLNTNIYLCFQLCQFLFYFDF